MRNLIRSLIMTMVLLSSTSAFANRSKTNWLLCGDIGSLITVRLEPTGLIQMFIDVQHHYVNEKYAETDYDTLRSKVRDLAKLKPSFDNMNFDVEMTFDPNNSKPEYKQDLTATLRPINGLVARSTLKLVDKSGKVIRQVSCSEGY